jgi:hypothetical protein
MLELAARKHSAYRGIRAPEHRASLGDRHELGEII